MTKEQDLAGLLGVSIQELRDFRTQELDEEIHYEPKPFRYTEQGVKAATDWFTKSLPVPDTSLPVEVEFAGAPKSPVPAGPAQPTSQNAQRLSPLRPAGLPEAEVGYAYPIVSRIPPNRNLVVCDVGPYRNVRVGVKTNEVYVPRMTIPLAVSLATFDPHSLIVFTGKGPRRKGCW